jgi:tripartite ATP-independent transporter DctP family solute receptor
MIPFQLIFFRISKHHQRRRKMKRLAMLLVVSVVFIPLASGSVTQAAAIEMKLGHFAADSHPGNLASKMFAEAVEKRTNGSIKVIIYPNNALGSPPEVLEQNILGAVDMSLPTQGQLGKYSKKFNCVMLPFIFNNYDQADKVLDGKFLPWAVSDLDKAGLVFLSNWEWGFRNLTNSKRPVNVPADVKGLKVRTPPELPTQAAMEALGAVVATINFNELQMALKTGVVDGQENPIAVIYSNKIYETQKYLAMTGHNYNTMVHVISKKVWDKLTPPQQAIVKEESKRAGDWMRKTCRDEETDQISQLKKFGMEITYPDKSEFKKLMKPAYDRMKAIADEDNIAAFIKMVDEAK